MLNSFKSISKSIFNFLNEFFIDCLIPSAESISVPSKSKIMAFEKNYSFTLCL